MLESLQRRPRGRQLSKLLGLAGVSDLGPPQWTGRRGLPRREFPFEIPPSGRVTQSLYERLDAADVNEVESRLEPGDAELWNMVDPEHRKVLVLAYGTHYRVPGVLEKTGLNPSMPPESVHAMSHQSTDAGGAYFYADMTAEALDEVGFVLEPGMRGLDFGCSSGRVLRLLALAFPQVDWFGCDPNGAAIEWASANLPGISFFNSDTEPPLALEDRSLDLAVAVSIWSHFAEPSALAWFEEMHRLIRPGGLLLFTVQGWHGLQLFAERRHWSDDDIERTASDLYIRGFSYMDVFGEQGDHGVKHPDWGMAHLSSEWLATMLCPDWGIVDFKPGRVEGHQDLVVIERRS